MASLQMNTKRKEKGVLNINLPLQKPSFHV